MSAFSATEFLRYSRHIQLPNFGVNGQLALKNSHAVVIGCGGLGAPVAQYLVAAGVGHITLVDGDNVELSNLQRQIVFTENDIGQSKAESTKQRLAQLNSDVAIDAVKSHLTTENCASLLEQADVVADCTDNFAARYLINDTCKQLNKPWVYASIFQYSGQLAVFTPDGACFRCLFPEPPVNTPDCNTAGVLGVLPGILGTLQAAEILKVLTNSNSVLLNHLLMVETTDMLFQTFNMRSDNACPACNGQLGSTSQEIFYTPHCASDEPSAHLITGPVFDAAREKPQEYLVVDVRTTAEHKAFNLNTAHVELNTIDNWLETLQDSRTLIFYCQSGARSDTAATKAIDCGKAALSLQGGLQNYLQINR